MKLNDCSDETLPRLAARRLTVHKGDFGSVLVVAGSRNMTGAAAIVGLATLRSGAGLVTIATPRSAQPVVASFSPCYMTCGMQETEQGTMTESNASQLAAESEKFDVLAVGPGLGRAVETARLVVRLIRETPRPMVVDADGLNALAVELEGSPRSMDRPPASRVLTPHGGEFLRLTGESPAPTPTARAAQAAALCRRDTSGRTIVVIKGHQTVVSDGERFAINATGNPGMATGGCGDCLTGVIAALLGQGLNAWDAARLGAYVHGLAGDLAADALGETALIATDVIEFLPPAWLQLGRSSLEE